MLMWFSFRCKGLFKIDLSSSRSRFYHGLVFYFYHGLILIMVAF